MNQWQLNQWEVELVHHSNMTSPTIINWNIRGFNANRNELEIIHSEFKPTFITLQETKLKTDIKFKNYKLYNKIKTCQTNTASGGVMILADNNIYTELLDIDTTLQAIAIKTTHPTDFTLCNVYLDHGLRVTELKNEFDKLIRQLGPKFIITGDFNAHNPIWGSHKTDAKGNTIEELIDEHSLTIKNEHEPTHLASSNGRLTAIDVTLCTQQLADDFEWTVLDDLHGSDHFPIILNFTDLHENTGQRERFKIDNADWTKFRQNLIFDNINKTDIDSFTSDLKTCILTAAKASMKVSKGFHGKRKLPYWNDEIKDKIIERKRAIRQFKRTLDSDIKENINRLSTEIHELLNKHKTKSWHEFTTSINYKSTTKEVYDKVRTLNGKHKGTEIKTLMNADGNYVNDQKEIANTLKNNLQKTYRNNILTNRPQAIPQDSTNRPYNDTITLQELEQALANCKGTSPGHDDIQYEMIRQLDRTGKQVLLELYNKIFDSGQVPQTWKHSLVIPILFFFFLN